MSRRSSALDPELGVLKPQNVGFVFVLQKSQDEMLQANISCGELRLLLDQAFNPPAEEEDFSFAPCRGTACEEHPIQPGGSALEVTDVTNVTLLKLLIVINQFL